MAAIHRFGEILTHLINVIWEGLFRQVRWIGASSYRVLLTILVSVFVLLSVAFGWAITSYTQEKKWSDDEFRQMIASALAAHRTNVTSPIQGNTPTPFVPVEGTPVVIPTPIPVSMSPLAENMAESADEPLPTAPSKDFYGINFSSGKDRISIKIFPKSKNINGGKPILISFLPGRRCNFGDQRACVYAYLNENLGNTIFISVHSGEGGEAQAFRHALEGTLVNSGAYTVKRVQSNMKALDGAKVIISQGKKTVDGLELSFMSRIPPRSLRKYLVTGLFDALSLAVSNRGNLQYDTDPASPQIVFETCGWRLPGEALSSTATATSASIYISVIRKASDE